MYNHCSVCTSPCANLPSRPRPSLPPLPASPAVGKGRDGFARDNQPEKECIMVSFGVGTCMGIRSLPDALRPDFRRRLYEQLIELGE